MPMIAAALAEAGLGFADLDRIVSAPIGPETCSPAFASASPPLVASRSFILHARDRSV